MGGSQESAGGRTSLWGAMGLPSARPPARWRLTTNPPAPACRYEKYDTNGAQREKTDDPFTDELNMVADKVQDMQLVRDWAVGGPCSAAEAPPGRGEGRGLLLLLPRLSSALTTPPLRCPSPGPLPIPAPAEV